MITYARLADTPSTFPALTGLTRDEFDRLFVAFMAAGARPDTHQVENRPLRAADNPGTDP